MDDGGRSDEIGRLEPYMDGVRREKSLLSKEVGEEIVGWNRGRRCDGFESE